MTTWPVTLPASPLVENFREILPKTTIRTEMDQGPAKIRQRTTAAVRELNLNYLLTKAQTETLDEFYLTTLSGGALAFDFAHPRNGDAISCRFIRPPEYGTTNGNYYTAAIMLEVLP